MVRQNWSFLTTSRCCRSRPDVPNSTRSRTYGSSCATTGSPTASSRHTMTSSTTAASLGTNWSISRGGSCPLACDIGRMGTDQCTLVLALTMTPRPRSHNPMTGTLAAATIAPQWKVTLAQRLERGLKRARGAVGSAVPIHSKFCNYAFCPFRHDVAGRNRSAVRQRRMLAQKRR